MGRVSSPGVTNYFFIAIPGTLGRELERKNLPSSKIYN
jgi:hypothetical protein